MNLRLSLAVVAFLACSAISTVIARTSPNVNTQQFTIEASDNKTAMEAHDALLRVIADAEAILDDTVRARINVRIVDTRAEFNQAVHGGIPDWGAGCAIPSQNLIVILSPRSAEYQHSFSEIIRHEWGHIALRHKVGNGYLPRFLDEGFAMDLAGQWDLSFAAILAKAQIMGKLFPLRSIDRVNFFNASQAQIAYAESYQALKYFRATYGKSSFVILLDQLRNGIALDAAMYSAIGADFGTFESEYIKYIGQHYGWLMIFSDMTFIWIGLALLIVIGYLLKKKRGQDTIKRWEEEEKYESTDFDYEEGDPWD